MKNISAILYERFKLHWMITHGFTLKDIFALVGNFGDVEINDCCDGDFEAYLEDVGFGSGSLWPCYDEFLDNEYQIEDLMKSLCQSDQEWTDYQKSFHRNLIFTDGDSGLLYWSNACGELHHHGKELIEEQDLPAELYRAYNLYWAETYPGLCYLVEKDEQYGIALICEFETDLDEENELHWGEVQKAAVQLAQTKELECATIIGNAYGGCEECHELIAFFPAMIKKAEFDAAVAKWSEIINQ